MKINLLLTGTFLSLISFSTYAENKVSEALDIRVTSLDSGKSFKPRLQSDLQSKVAQTKTTPRLLKKKPCNALRLKSLKKRTIRHNLASSLISSEKNLHSRRQRLGTLQARRKLIASKRSQNRKELHSKQKKVETEQLNIVHKTREKTLQDTEKDFSNNDSKTLKVKNDINKHLNHINERFNNIVNLQNDLINHLRNLQNDINRQFNNLMNTSPCENFSKTKLLNEETESKKIRKKTLKSLSAFDALNLKNDMNGHLRNVDDRHYNMIRLQNNLIDQCEILENDFIKQNEQFNHLINSKLHENNIIILQNDIYNKIEHSNYLLNKIKVEAENIAYSSIDIANLQNKFDKKTEKVFDIDIQEK